MPNPDAIKQFHAHLDDCHQCRDNPFDLCPIGHVLITAAGRAEPVKYGSALPVKDFREWD